MRRNSLNLFVLTATFLAIPAIAHADCAADIDKFETSFNDRLKEERGKLSDHPLVLVMADGRLVDMRGTETDAQPTERWFVTDKDAVENIRSGIEDARKAYSDGDMTTCESTYNDLQSRLTQ